MNSQRYGFTNLRKSIECFNTSFLLERFGEYVKSQYIRDRNIEYKIS